MSRYTVAVSVDEDRFALMNAASGAVDIVNCRVAELISSWQLTGVDASTAMGDLIASLRTRGYLTDDSREEELRAVRRLCERLKRSRAYPKQHFVVVTYNCNLRCPYCYERHLRTRGERWLEETLDAERVDRIFAAIDQFDRETTCSAKLPITLYGGEPLLCRNAETVEYILHTGAERGHSFTVVTNGFRLPEFAPLLSKYPVTHVHVTLDGPPEVHNARRFTASGAGTFDRIILGIEEATRRGLSSQVRIHFDVTTSDSVPRLLQHLDELCLGTESGLKPYIRPVFDSPEADGALDRLLDLYTSESRMECTDDQKSAPYPHLRSVFHEGSRLGPRSWYCDAHTTDLFYDPFGDVYTCSRGIGSREFAVGKYIPELMLNETYKDWMTRTVLDLESCSECKYALLCGGGCAFEAHRKEGTIQVGHCGSLRRLVGKYIPHLYQQYVGESSRQA